MSPPELQCCHAQGRPKSEAVQSAAQNMTSRETDIKKFMGVPQLLMCLFCQVAERFGKNKSFAPVKEKLEVHNSLWVEMKSAARPSLGPRQDQSSGDTFINALPLIVLEMDSHCCLSHPSPHVSDSLPPPPPSLPPPPLCQHLFPHSHCIPPVMGADRHSSSAGTLAQVDQVSHLPADCAACAHLWLSAAQLEALSAALVCCHVR